MEWHSNSIIVICIVLRLQLIIISFGPGLFSVWGGGGPHINNHSFLWKTILKVNVMVSEWLTADLEAPALKPYLSFSIPPSLLSLSLLFQSSAVKPSLAICLCVYLLSLSLSISLPPSLPPLTFFAVSRHSQITVCLSFMKGPLWFILEILKISVPTFHRSHIIVRSMITLLHPVVARLQVVFVSKV